MGRVDGKVALVTGGASGIGRATAELFVREGGRVVIADRDPQAAGVAAALGEDACFVALDVTKEADWARALAETTARFGGLDALVNGAGVGVQADIETVTLEQWRFVHAVNTEGVFLGCQAAVRAMKERGGGSIVNISSIAGLVGDPTLPAYCSSKGAVRLLTKSVALHCARKKYGIRCNSVHPSFIDTPMVDKMCAGARDPDKRRAMLEAAAPLGRMGEPGEVALLILYLASDESRFVTGAELVIDGGLTAT